MKYEKQGLNGEAPYNPTGHCVIVYQALLQLKIAVF